MTAAVPNDLARALRAFFADHLPRVRGTSPHTIRSYRDSLVLLLRFVATQTQRSVIRLDLDDLGPSRSSRSFSTWSSTGATASLPATCAWPRSTRSSGIAQWSTPHGSNTVNASSPSRSSGPAAAPWSTSSTRRSKPSWASSIRRTADGRRDYALLATMFNTGARVQEIVVLSVADLRLDAPAQVRLHGKGRKERVCPLWPQTADLLRALLAERGRELQSDEPVFRNHRGMRLTRFGVRYLLQKYCTRAQASVPALRAKRLHPHSMRHSTAVHLLRAGVDIVTISQWLRPRQRHDHAPLRHRRSRHETAGTREGPSHHRRHRGTGPVAHGPVRAGNGLKHSEEAIGNVESGDLPAPEMSAALRRYSTLLIAQH